MNKKITKYTSAAILITFVTGSLYVAGLMGVSTISNKLSPKINSQTQLEEVVEREKKKLDPLNKFNISAKLSPRKVAVSRSLRNGKYEIEIDENYATESRVKHELYHIIDGHCDDVYMIKSKLGRNLKYLFWYEPQAVIYQSTGLKP